MRDALLRIRMDSVARGSLPLSLSLSPSLSLFLSLSLSVFFFYKQYARVRIPGNLRPRELQVSMRDERENAPSFTVRLFLFTRTRADDSIDNIKAIVVAECCGKNVACPVIDHRRTHLIVRDHLILIA
jgi:hypothetical protein